MSGPAEPQAAPGGGARRLVSLVVPAYDERDSAAGIVGFFREIRQAYDELDFELVLVDDGSVDGTAQAVANALQPGELGQLVRLSRNFGSHAAITAGLDVCRGDAALTLSADLQEPLEVIGRFLEEWRTGAHVVWGVRSTRAVPKGLANLGSRLFSQVFNRVSEIPTYPRQGPSQVLVDRRVIDVLRRLPEVNRNVLGMVAWSGFTQRTISFDQLPRPHGASKWTTKKKIKLLIDSMVEFSWAPVRWLGYAGAALAATGAGVLLVTLVVALAQLRAPSGLALVSAVVLGVGGAQLLGMQVLGEYLWRAGDDARRRPVYVLREAVTVGRRPGSGGTNGRTGGETARARRPGGAHAAGG